MRQSLEILIEQYQKSLYAAAFNICKIAEDANDVVQDTFIQYYISSKQFKDEEHLKAWLLRVAINRAKDVTRSFWRRNKIPLEEYTEQISFETSQDSDLFEAVMKLSEKYRVVLHLYYYEDMSVKEIAKILRVSEAGIKMRLSRGRSLLKDIFKEEKL
jgi:RNA polymerase sigma-70 factor (ECF subfamily)